MKNIYSGNAVAKRIAALREVMRGHGFAACIVPTADPHMSEYIDDHYKSREFITGFTGSAGTAVITDSDAGLWTDSRYWLQAAEELEESGVRLFKDGEPDTPSIESWLCRQLNAGDVVSVPGDTISIGRAKALREFFRPHEITLDTGSDPVNEIRTDRPALQMHEITELSIDYAGLSRTEKLDLIRHDVARTAAESDLCSGERYSALLLTSLDDIAWLMNLRGSDIPCNPAFYSFVIISAGQVRLYALDGPSQSDLSPEQRDSSQELSDLSPEQYDLSPEQRTGHEAQRISPSLLQSLESDGIHVLPYQQFYEDLRTLENAVALLDQERCSQRILESLPASADWIESTSPVMLRKCIKNRTEMDGIRNAHLRDGIAMCRFLCWLKREMSADQTDGIAGTDDGSGQTGFGEHADVAGQLPLTELSIAEKLFEFRNAQENFRGESFDPIIGYGPHGAIVHYSATEQSNAQLHPNGLLLIDSGGQYPDGTTDITRTIVLGPLTEEEKRCFTAVLRGHINLARACFPEGFTGAHLDILAHQPLWALGLDYSHGTGHGVGAFLNVHEDPLRIHWAAGKRSNTASGSSNTSDAPALEGPGTAPVKRITQDLPVFAEGMLVSNEPGYYETGKFGVRHENLMLVVPASQEPAGPDSSDSAPSRERSFLQFESVTLVPFDLDGIDPSLMQPDEIAWLNSYHRQVFEAVAPHLDDTERAWLAEATRSI